MAEQEPDEAKAEADKTHEWDAEVLNNLMSNPKGRYWMERLLDRCGSRLPRFLGDGEEHCPDRFLQMIRDRRARVGRAQKKLEEQEAQQRNRPKGVTAIDDMADAQLAEAQRPKPKDKQ